MNPFPRQLSDDDLRAQFNDLRAIDRPTLVQMVDLKATVAEMIRRRREETS